MFPELVTAGAESGLKSLDYGRLTAILIQAVRELRDENLGLAREMKRLKARPWPPSLVVDEWSDVPATGPVDRSEGESDGNYDPGGSAGIRRRHTA